MSGKITYYDGLLREGSVQLNVETTTATFPAYIGIMAAAEGITSGYYYLSLERDARFNSKDYPTQYFSQIETALGISLVNGDRFIATPYQDGLTKQQRQIQKLDISSAIRKSDSNPRYTYDINKLPNPYNGNSAAPDDGASTLTVGRPWS